MASIQVKALTGQPVQVCQPNDSNVNCGASAGSVSSVTASNAGLTVTPTTGSVTAGVNWTDFTIGTITGVNWQGFYPTSGQNWTDITTLDGTQTITGTKTWTAPQTVNSNLYVNTSSDLGANSQENVYKSSAWATSTVNYGLTSQNINSGNNAVGSGGHGGGILGWAKDTVNNEMPVIGVEGRGDCSSSNGISCEGLNGDAIWTDPDAGNGTTFTGSVIGDIFQAYVYAHNGSTPRNQGTAISGYVGSPVGGATDYGLFIAPVTNGTTANFPLFVESGSIGTTQTQIMELYNPNNGAVQIPPAIAYVGNAYTASTNFPITWTMGGTNAYDGIGGGFSLHAYISGVVNSDVWYCEYTGACTFPGTVTATTFSGSGVSLTNIPTGAINWPSINSIPNLNTGAVNWNNINGTITINNGAINWASFNAAGDMNSGGINWNDINIHALLNNGGINWQSLYPLATGVNWGGLQTATAFTGTGSGDSINFKNNNASCVGKAVGFMQGTTGNYCLGCCTSGTYPTCVESTCL